MKKILSFLLITLLTLSITLLLASCGGGNTPDTSSDEDTETNTDTNGETTEQPQDPSDPTPEEPGQGEEKCLHDGGYKFGACLSCGEVKECAHEKTTLKYEALGNCGSGYAANVCEECNAYELLSFNSDCDGKISKDGRKIECDSCGLIMSLTNVGGTKCQEILQLEAIIGEETLVKAISHLPLDHINEETQIIDLGETFECGVRVIVTKCLECDEIVSFVGASHSGELTVSEDEKDGTKTRSCPECGFKEITKIIKKNECDTSTKVEIFKNDELVFEKEQPNEVEHEIKVEYALIGKTCLDGYLATITCEKCNATEYEFDTMCHEGKTETVSLDGISPCGGEYSINKCEICKRIVDSSYFATKCNGTTTSKTEYDENGREIQVNIITCMDCGLVYETRYCELSDFLCTSKLRAQCKMYIGDNVLYELEKVIRGETHHDEEYSYELLGDTCLDGIKQTITCARGCGYERTSIINRHYICKTNQTKLHGVCDGSVLYESHCPCGEVKSYGVYNLCGTSTFEELENDATKQTIVCEECGLSCVKETFFEKENCSQLEKQKITLCVGETVCLDGEVITSAIYEYHESEIEYILLGSSCNDGFIAISKCKDCKNTEYEFDNYHSKVVTEKKVINTSCGESEITISTCPCKEQTSIQYEMGCDVKFDRRYDTDENGLISEYYTYECGECGMKIRYDVVLTKAENCRARENCLMEFTYENENGEEETLSYSYVGGYEQSHDFVYTYNVLGGSCDNEVEKITTCRDCDYLYTQKYSGHMSTEGEGYDINLKYYGACGGEYRYGACPCDEKHITFSFSMYNCQNNGDVQTTTSSETIDGVQYNTVVSSCEKCGLSVITVSHMQTEGCYVYEYITRTIKIGERVLVDAQEEKHQKEVNHELVYEYKLMDGATTCKDGWTTKITCTMCEYSEFYIADWCERVVTIDSESLMGQVCIDHYFEFESCLCGKEQYAYFSETGFSEENGVYSCENCDLVIKITEETEEQDNCILEKATVTELILGSETLFVKREEKSYNVHNFKVESISKADDVLYVTTVCQDCEATFEQEVHKVGELVSGSFGNEYLIEFSLTENGYYSAYTISDVDLYTLVYESEMLISVGDNEKNGDLTIQDLYANEAYKIGVSTFEALETTEGIMFVIANGKIPYESEHERDKEIKSFTVSDGEVSYVIEIRTECGLIQSVKASDANQN